jgi:spore germination protein YaaH
MGRSLQTNSFDAFGGRRVQLATFSPMSWQRLRISLLLICMLGALTVGNTPAAAAAPDRTPASAGTASRVQAGVPAGPRNAIVGTGARDLSKEVFGFALGSSLSDPTVGYPSWNFDMLSTVAYFGLHVLWDGTFQKDAGLAVWNSSQLTSLVQVAHAHGTKVVLTIINGDARGTYPNAMCDALLRASTTVKNTVAEVKAKGVDGVNIDYEGVNQACNTSDPSWARHALTSFATSMRVALGTTSYLSIDTYSGAAGDPVGFFDVPGLNPSVDSFFVMAYDMEYSNYYRAPSSCAHFCLGPTSPLTSYYYNDTTVMAQYSAAVTPAKVILGVPYYGRKACVTSAIQYQRPVGAVTADTYLSASQEISDPSVRPGSYVIHRDAHDAGKGRWDTWYSTTLGCIRELTWDDALSLSLKYDLVNRAHLRGVGIWTLNYGGGASELWNALASRFGGWTASYDMSKAPTGWGVGQTQTFPVSVTNTGTQTWPSTGSNAVDLGVHFSKTAGGSLNQAAWLSSRTFSLPHDVAPGQSATLSVTVTAPATAGPVVLEAEMTKENEFWFQQWQPFNVTVLLWAAAYDMSKVPKSWGVGQSQTFPVTLTNTGGYAWPSTGYTRVDLDLHFTTRAGGAPKSAYWLNSKAFSLPGDVAPGASVTLNVTFTAPSVIGTFVLEAEMIKEHQFWFKQWAPLTVAVVPASWSAGYDLSKAPRTWTLGQSQTFPVTVTNTGNQTWPSAISNRVDLDLHFTSRTGGSAFASYWLTSKAYALPSNVAPGKSVTLTVTLSAPPRFGSMYLEAEMIKEHEFWFKKVAAVATIAAPAGWSAAYDVTQVPTSWIVGIPQTFSVSVTNNGTLTWPASGFTEVDLDLHFATAAGGAANAAQWVGSKAFKLPRDVPPGQTVSVQVTVTPTRPGALVLEAEMIKEHEFWFLQFTPVSVTVSPWAAIIDMSKAPTTWVATQAQTFPVTVTNAGGAVWPSTGFTKVDLDLHFATRAGGSAKAAYWLNSKAFALPADLAPGASVTVNVTFAAPSTAGALVLEAQMIKEHEFWFAQWQPVSVSVAAAVWSARYSLAGVPTTWVKGQAQNVMMTVTNTSNVTWPSRGYYRVDLDLHFTTRIGGSSKEAYWLTSKAYSLPADLAPGKSVTLTISVLAPSISGSMYLEAEMVKEHQFWFAATGAIPVSVR